MSRTTIELKERWNAMNDTPSAFSLKERRSLLERIAVATINDREDAAFKVSVALTAIDDDDERALVPEDISFVAMLRSVGVYLSR